MTGLIDCPHLRIYEDAAHFGYIAEHGSNREAQRFFPMEMQRIDGALREAVEAWHAELHAYENYGLSQE